MAKKTILAPKTKGKKVPGKLTDYELDYLQYLLEDEYDKGVVVRRAMTHREVADYLTLKTAGEQVAFLDTMGAIDSAAL
jgi:hypothetical protein